VTQGTDTTREPTLAKGALGDTTSRGAGLIITR
jgi:hypothetical protein